MTTLTINDDIISICGERAKIECELQNQNGDK